MLTVREVARFCGRSEETVRRWIWSGRLPASKLGNQLFVRREDVDAMLSPGTGEPMATYGTRREEQATKLNIPKMKYDRDQMIKSLERVLVISEELERAHGFYDVTEALRRVREEEDQA